MKKHEHEMVRILNLEKRGIRYFDAEEATIKESSESISLIDSKMNRI